jgi:hypothetical protein
MNVTEKTEEIMSRLRRENWVLGDYFHALYVEGIQRFLKQDLEEIKENCHRNGTDFFYFVKLQTSLKKKLSSI